MSLGSSRRKGDLVDVPYKQLPLSLFEYLQNEGCRSSVPSQTPQLVTDF
ncbi:hypothetical protein F441_22411 [Phytophthora nicotianae CJ01A1]|uniref:Uncharacterized protein n=3 Tax=Phytophthora nicotianae TaxID=4792 RepID=W2XZ30_PHYNI|nr:hypothetical protein L915_01166 [Phytophthora nicotianae]ETP00164.1 hypothetical protein F441_22411 [Phytophthora nicotianae CJ01A1]ETP27653.1 hypothetical protein F442_23068 [Phytophthora nicotianae P10297]